MDLEWRRLPRQDIQVGTGQGDCRTSSDRPQQAASLVPGLPLSRPAVEGAQRWLPESAPTADHLRYGKVPERACQAMRES